ADLTRVVGGEEGTDNEVADLDLLDLASDLFDHADVLVAHRGRLGDRLHAPIGPQIGTAYACRRERDHSIARFKNASVVSLLETNVSWTVQNSTFHCRSSFLPQFDVRWTQFAVRWTRKEASNL